MYSSKSCRSPTYVESSVLRSFFFKVQEPTFSRSRHFPFPRHIITRLRFPSYNLEFRWQMRTASKQLLVSVRCSLIRCKETAVVRANGEENDDKSYRVTSWKSFLIRNYIFARSYVLVFSAFYLKSPLFYDYVIPWVGFGMFSGHSQYNRFNFRKLREGLHWQPVVSCPCMNFMEIWSAMAVTEMKRENRLNINKCFSINVWS